jgi:A nuclease family of the HNH/ENDO VII superfamily with conserved AHH
MAGTQDKLDNTLNRPQDNRVAYISPLDWIDYAALAIDGIERGHIELTMPEGKEKDSARLINNMYTAIDVVMAATPGGGGGGPALRVAMATSHEAAEAAWRAIPDPAKQRLIEQVARGMDWSLGKTGQALNVLFSEKVVEVRNRDGQTTYNAPPEPPQEPSSEEIEKARKQAAGELRKGMDKGNDVLELQGKPRLEEWESKKGYDAHHVVLFQVPKNVLGPYVKQAQELLKKYKIELNSDVNGVYLPRNKVPGARETPHQNVHTEEYTRTVFQRLQQAEQRQGNPRNNILNELGRIRQELIHHTFPYKTSELQQDNNRRSPFPAVDSPELIAQARAINPVLYEAMDMMPAILAEQKEIIAIASQYPPVPIVMRQEQNWNVRTAEPNLKQQDPSYAQVYQAAAVTQRWLNREGSKAAGGELVTVGEHFTAMRSGSVDTLYQASSQYPIVEYDRSTGRLTQLQPMSGEESMLLSAKAEQDKQQIAQENAQRNAPQRVQEQREYGQMEYG